MILQSENAAAIGPYALENTVTIKKSMIEDRDCGLFGRDKFSVNINEIHRASPYRGMAKNKCILIGHIKIGVPPIPNNRWVY
ncbi:Uncharacterised protein [uncultured archaeon]|nr:Uncharacterised protein [uncultured archaeon]